MIRNFFLCLLLMSPSMSLAGVLLTPRLDGVAGETEVLAQRGQLKSKIDFKSDHWGFFFEGFAEEDLADSAAVRRSPPRGYLNEIYFEYQSGSLFLKAGKHSLRWSEMWIVPSLDLWTARRYQRLYWDPFSDQMEHSAGASLSIVRDLWSWDFAFFPKVSLDQYPEPIPEITDDEQSPSFGARFKISPDQLSLSLLGAKKNKQTWIGIQPSMAFEAFVLKGEWGLVSSSEEDTKTPNRDENFFSLGLDLFMDQWTVTPQATLRKINEIGGRQDTTESLYYLAAVRQQGKHDFQTQVFYASQLRESFASVSYAYSINDHLIVTAFVQGYDGQVGSLHRIYKELVGGSVAGARIELPFGI